MATKSAKARTTKKSTTKPKVTKVSTFGWNAFSGLMLILVGLLHTMIGLTALFKDDVFVASGADVWILNYSQWGWVNIICGLIALTAAFMLLKNHKRATKTAIEVAMVSAVIGAAFVPIYSVWATILVATSVIVTYSVAVHSND